VLLKSGMYPQAVFLIQQALEKAIKAIALELNLITPEDVWKELGHYVVERLIDCIVTDARNLYIDLLKMCRKGNETNCKVLKDFEDGVGYWLSWIPHAAMHIVEAVKEFVCRKCEISVTKRRDRNWESCSTR